MKKFLILILSVILYGATVYNEGFQNFTVVNPESTRNVNGNYAIVGNTVECVTNSAYNFDGQCIGTFNYHDNDNHRFTKYIDIDGNNSTWNSSVATFKLPSNYDGKILWAGLFWQGNVNNDFNYYNSEYKQKRAYLDPDAPDGWRYKNITSNKKINIEDTDANKILLKINNTPYQSITANTLDYYRWYDNYGMVYAGYADVTNNVKSILENLQPNSEVNVTVANITTNEGRETSLGDFAGWSMVVIYETNMTDLSNFKRVMIYNGYKILTRDPDFNESEINITNLYLPPEGDVNSFLGVFTGEGDYPYTPDTMELDGYPMPGALNPNNIFDSRIAGVNRPNIGDNNLTNTDGIDIDEYNVTSIMTDIRNKNPDTTSVTIKLTTGRDAFFPSMVVYSTRLYVPHFCYDYSFMQDGVYITTPYVPNQFPKLPEFVKEGDDINVSIYLRNTEQNDIIAKDIKFHIEDINTTHLDFQPDSIYLYKSEDGITEYIDPSEFNISVSGSDLNVTNIPFGDVNGTVYRYLYFALRPQTNELNDTINGYFTYRLYKVINGEVIDIPMPKTPLKLLPMCQENYVYEPAWSVFNVSDKNIYDIDPTKYNIPTQVSGRSNDYMVVSYDANNTNQEKDYNYSVILEAINVGGFHDINASCFNPNTPRFDINNILQLPVDFNGSKHIEETLAINGAIRNAAFRIKYIDWEKYFEKLTNGCNDKTQSNTLKGVPECLTDENNFKEAFGDNSPCLNICFNNTSPNPDGYDCLRCLADDYGNKVCSRDNFSVRPDSFYVIIKDPVSNNSIITNTVSNPTAKLAAGVNYKADINATSYLSTNGIKGYVRYFNANNINDYNVSLLWNSDKNLSVCNDISNRFLTFYMINGVVNSQDFNNTEIGEYNFTISDKDWTRVDWDPAYLTHHTNSVHSANFFQGSDCEENSSIVEPVGTQITESNGELEHLNGCVIDNKNHFSPGLNRTFKEINATYVPYKFVFNTNVSYSLANLTNFPGWLYDTDIKQYPKDENNSLKIKGYLLAEAKGGSITKNFVNECFAKDVNITIGYVNNNPTAVKFIYKVNEDNGSKQYYDINDTLVLNKNNFLKSNQGKTTVNILINYPKEFNQTVRPIDFNLTDLNASPYNNNELSYEYNNTNMTAKGDINFSKEIVFRYGRIKVSTAAAYSNDINTTFLYQYWTDSQGWVTNTEHNSTAFGDFNHTLNSAINPYVTVTSAPSITNGQEKVVFHTTHALPYSAKVHLQINSWLWYYPLAKDYKDPSPANTDCRTHPCLKLDFLKSGSGWGGVQAINNAKFSEENRTSDMNMSRPDVNVSKSQVKKINW